MDGLLKHGHRNIPISCSSMKKKKRMENCSCLPVMTLLQGLGGFLLAIVSACETYGLHSNMTSFLSGSLAKSVQLAALCLLQNRLRDLSRRMLVTTRQDQAFHHQQWYLHQPIQQWKRVGLHASGLAISLPRRREIWCGQTGRRLAWKWSGQARWVPLGDQGFPSATLR